MNSTRDTVRICFPGFVTDTASRTLPRAGVSPLTRAGLPVVGNRAFVSAWISRRRKLTVSVRSN